MTPTAMLARRILELRNPRSKLRRSLFGPQLKLFEDPSPEKAACCTRRAGKSHVAAVASVDAALERANVDVLYLGLTRMSSKSIMWPKFYEIKSLVPGLEMKESDLLVTTPNGSRIRVMGADMENLADRIRGNKFARVIIDEAQSFGPHVQYLIDDVLGPALLDLQGDLWLLGTPGPVPAGVFFDAMQSPMSNFSRHSWSLLQNPHLPHAGEWLERLKQRKGWTDENPTFRREYLGEWCHDPDSLVYRFNAERNRAESLPDGHEWHYVLGLDYGWHDQTAFSVLAYAEHHPAAYVLRSWGHSGLIPSKIAEMVQALHDQYDFEAIVCDTGGLGKSITEEFRQRYGLPVKAAEKTDKMSFIASMNGDFIDGKIFLLPGTEQLQHEYQTLQYDDRRREDPALPNHCADATTYGFRYLRHYLATELAPRHAVGSPGWIAQEERDMMRAIEDQTKRQNERQDELFPC